MSVALGRFRENSHRSLRGEGTPVTRRAVSNG